MKTMSIKFSVTILTLIFTALIHSDIAAQTNTQVRDYYLNRDEPGSEYSFTFVHLTDIHIGEGQGDYGTPGYLNDTMPEGDIGYSAERLRKAVNWVNQNAAEKNIKFVLVTGDITDSGEKSEFDKAKEILDALEIPYVPTIGNHDIWPYVRYQDEAPYAYGDSVMAEIFKDTYEKASQFFDHWDDGTRLTRVYNPESGEFHYHQNFSFAYQGFGFLAFDFNPRYHVRKAEPGVGAEARLNNFENGTYQWLLNTIPNHPVKGNKNLILLTHQPPHRDVTALFNGLPLLDHDKMTRDLVRYRDHLGVWLAGHVHRNMNYSLRTIGGGIKVVDVKETAANKEYEEGFLALIHAYKVPVATSVREKEIADNILLLPNPVENYLTIQLPQNHDLSGFEVYNTKGEKVMAKQAVEKSRNTISISTSSLAKGMYIIQFQTEDMTILKNFIKSN